MDAYVVTKCRINCNMYVEELYQICADENTARRYADDFDRRHHIEMKDLYNIVPEEIYVEWVTMMQQYPELVMESYRKYPADAFTEQKFRVQLYDQQWMKCVVSRKEIKTKFE